MGMRVRVRLVRCSDAPCASGGLCAESRHAWRVATGDYLNLELKRPEGVRIPASYNVLTSSSSVMLP